MTRFLCLLTKLKLIMKKLLSKLGNHPRLFVRRRKNTTVCFTICNHIGCLTFILQKTPPKKAIC